MAKVKTIEIIDIENVRKEKLRYQKNNLAYGLCMLGCLVSLLAGFVGLNTVKATPITALKIFMNIVILLFGFSSAEQVKKYKTSASIICFVFAGVCVVRMFWFPINMIRWYNGNKMEKFSSIVYKSGSLSGNNPDASRGWLSSSGVFRGILMIVFLILASLSYAFAGYVGLSRSNKLHAYLKEINVAY